MPTGATRGSSRSDLMLFGKKEEEPQSLRKSKPAEEEVKCGISGCKEAVARSVPVKKAKAVFYGLDPSKRRIHLCKTHYKEFKKKTKGDRDAERWGWN